jgi:hypothetical protein
MMIAFSHADSVLDIRCAMCGTSYIITYNREDMLDWLSGQGFIQDVMPYLTAAERELLISNTCGSCFDKLFPAPIDNAENV